MPDCIFCRIVRSEISADIVAESADALAFRDLDPKAPVHVLIIPRRHVASVRELADAGDSGELGSLLAWATEVARAVGIDEHGYRLITNTGDFGGQSVHHLHFHLLGGRQLGWTPS